MINTKILSFLIPFTFSWNFALTEETGGKGNYYVEAYQQEDDATVLVLKLKPFEGTAEFEILKRIKPIRPRQEEDEDEDATPFIPAVIPALNKIFSGVLTGDLTQIFHGSTSFAPKDVNTAIDSVYNTVVGYTEPTTSTTTEKPTTVQVLAANATATEKAVTQETTTEKVVEEKEDVTTAEVEVTTTGDEDEGEAETTEDPETVVKRRSKPETLKTGRVLF